MPKKCSRQNSRDKINKRNEFPASIFKLHIKARGLINDANKTLIVVRMNWKYVFMPLGGHYAVPADRQPNRPLTYLTSYRTALRHSKINLVFKLTVLRIQ